MSSSNPPGTTTTGPASGEIDLSAMMAAHDAFRRDLVLLARTTTPANLADPDQRAAVLAGWRVFKHQLFLHHRGEDTFLWPPIREKLAGNVGGLAVLDAMTAEHEELDRIVSDVDGALGPPDGALGPPEGALAQADDATAEAGAVAGRLSEVIDNLITRLTLHLAHEERDALPLIREVLTGADWAAIVAALRASGNIDDAAEMVPWLMLDLPPHRAAEVMAFYPPFVAQKYADEWKPRFDAVPKWTA